MDTDEQIKLLQKVMDMLEQQLTKDYELVLHDLRKPFEHTIVDIRNGYITGRKVGDCSTNHGLNALRTVSENGDEYNYATYMPDGRVFRSSSMYVRDESGKAIISLCINQNITDTLKLEKALHEFNAIENQEVAQKEVFARNIQELLDFYIDQAQYHVGKRAEDMTRSEKIQMLEFLDKKGALQISKAGEHICNVLGISRFTLYNYLDQIRGLKKAQDEEETEL